MPSTLADRITLELPDRGSGPPVLPDPGERAECVMLNKGRYVALAVDVLDDILTRMQSHQRKKSAQLRELRIWQ